MPGSGKNKSTMITVEQLVDVALGTPEIGAVNFNVLHSLLHVIVQQLNIQRCLVEFKGKDSDRMEGLIMSARPGPILKLSEYIIDLNDGKGEDKETEDGGGGGGGGGGRGREDRSEDGKMERTESQTKARIAEYESKKRKRDDGQEKTDRGKDDSEETDREESKQQKKGKDEKKKKCVCKNILDEGGRPLYRQRDKEENMEDADEEGIKDIRDSSRKRKKGRGMADDRDMQEVGADGRGSSYYGSECDTCQTIVRIEAIGEKCDTWRTRPALAHENMVKLEERVAMLHKAFEEFDQMPTNQELITRTKTGGTAASGGNVSTPVKDMWQLYNLHKRTESCEGAIEKLATMIEDIVKDTSNFREAMLVIADAVDDLEGTDDANAGFRGGPHHTVTFRAQTHITSGGGLHGHENVGNVGSAAAGTATDHHPFRPGLTTPVSGSHESGDVTARSSFGIDASVSARARSPSEIEKERDNIQYGSGVGLAAGNPSAGGSIIGRPGSAGLAATSGASGVASGVSSGPETAAGQGGRIAFGGLRPLDGAFRAGAADETIMQQFKILTDAMPIPTIINKLTAVSSLQKELELVEKEWKEFMDVIGEGGAAGIVGALKSMKNDVENLSRSIAKILADRQELQSTLQGITEDMELIRKVKADKEIMEDLLAEKADAAIVNRKVSHSQFDAACDDLTKGLDEALEKLLAQEAMWNEAMEELQKDLDSKLDKTEIMPLKEFINKKLKGLQDKLKQLAQLRKDAEAAGAKSRILRNLNCIACDGDVVMRMENVSTAHAPGLPPHRSMRPYLTYELDQVRKALKKGPARNMNNFEEVVNENIKKNIGIPLSNRETIDHRLNKLEHLCNRYCGGSHTITTPQQRVTRIGHFLTEFGPQAMAMFTQDDPILEKKITDKICGGNISSRSEKGKRV